MYLKLALRNARRSITDYLLYMFTMVILISIICISNCLTEVTTKMDGFESMSLPLIIAIIMIFLIHYMNRYMLNQRAKELATYLLIGMEKGSLTNMFFQELCVIGMICYIIGVSLGVGLFIGFQKVILPAAADCNIWSYLWNSMGKTLLCFLMVEVFSFFVIRLRINRLSIGQLMEEKKKNYMLHGKHLMFWKVMFFASGILFITMLLGIVFCTEKCAEPLISIISFPMLCWIISFYQWFYLGLEQKRLQKSSGMYDKDNMYCIAEMTTGMKTNANVNAIFSICLLFAVISFLFGTILLNRSIQLFQWQEQLWMGFIQISLCIVFLIIYFSVLSLLQIIELKRQKRNFENLYYLGKEKIELCKLLKKQIRFKMIFPAFMSLVVMIVTIPLVNYFINQYLSGNMQDILVLAFGGFAVCFSVLYFCYYWIIYVVSRKVL